jgi:PAS domain S-box-containing protein
MLGSLGLRSRVVLLVMVAVLPAWVALALDSSSAALLGAVLSGAVGAWWVSGLLLVETPTQDIRKIAAGKNLGEGFALAQEEVLTLMAAGAGLGPSLTAIVLLIEKGAPGNRCSILLRRGPLLHHGAAPSLPAAFNDAIEGLRVAEGVGVCGTAAFRKEVVVVEDVTTDPLTADFRELLATHGIRACWSMPVLDTEGEVMATFAVYRSAPGKPDAGDMESMATATRLAGIALERARGEAALVDSEARFRELAENIDEVFYNRDAQTGQMLYISPCYEKIWGRSCESLYAEPYSCYDAIFSDDRPIVEAARSQNRAGQASDVQYRIAVGSQTRWVRDRAYPVFSAAGTVERVVGTVQDITSRMLADLALASTSRAMQMLSRSCVALNRMEDEDSLLAEICRVAVEVGNYKMAWVGYAQDDAECSIRPMARAGDEGDYLEVIKLSWSPETPIGRGPAGQVIRGGEPRQSGDIRRDKQFFWSELALAQGYRSALFLPLRSRQLEGLTATGPADGRPAGQGHGAPNFGLLCLYAGHVQQFSAGEVKLLQELADNLAFGIGNLRTRLERRRSLAAVRAASIKLQEQASLLDRSPDAILVRNMDLTIRYWSKGAERLYGWTSEEVMGRTMAERMYRSPEVLDGAMRRALQSGGDWTGELEQVARDGSSIYIEARWTLVRDEQGVVNGVMGVNSDMRERRRWRQQILELNASLEERVQQRTAQLEFANQQLEAFSYSVSHDLRTPLSSIDGFSMLLQKSLDQEDAGDQPFSDRRGHYLSRIRAGVLQMGELIDAMLALAQVSRSRLRWEAVDLSALANALLASYQEHHPGQRVQLSVEPGLMAQGDPRLLNQVLDNLLGNAWKFSAAKVVTQISFGRETLAVPGSDDAATEETVYVVRDKGAGFDMAYADKLFGAFQRLHSPTEFAGSGIGLTTVQRIISRHGGRVWGESAPGQGAAFFFTLGNMKLDG